MTGPSTDVRTIVPTLPKPTRMVMLLTSPPPPTGTAVSSRIRFVGDLV